jgi:hypothetical protein
MRTHWRVATVFFIAGLALAWNVQRAGIASGHIDSINKLGAQDESLYTREAIQMATHGNWLTPMFLGRYVLFKPPLLMWLSAASTKVFGISSLPIRLPALLAGALICAIAFAVARNDRSTSAAVAVPTLLVSNQLFHTLARVNMTDILLSACITAAFAFFLSDPTLQRRLAFWGFSISVAAGIMTKSIAGLLPLAAVFLCCLVGHASACPSWRRAVQAALAIAIFVLPWHLYQLFTHYRWFATEYFGIQLLTFGKSPPQTSQESQLLFYLRRLAFGDPVLALLALTGLPGLLAAAVKRTRTLPLLLLCWIAVFSSALLVFQYRSAQYLLPLIPALAIAAAVYSPVFSNGRSWIAIALLGLAFAVKAAQPQKPWGLAYGSGTTIGAARTLSEYCEKRRPTDLFVLLVPDEFYSAVLPIPHVRYAWLDPSGSTPTLNPYLHYLGIVLAPDEFQNLARDQEMYHQRLREWKLDSTEPLGTAVYARNADELKPLILSRPHSDFFAPREVLNGIADRVTVSHQVVDAPEDRILLLAKEPSGERAFDVPGWSCRM